MSVWRPKIDMTQTYFVRRIIAFKARLSPPGKNDRWLSDATNTMLALLIYDDNADRCDRTQGDHQVE